MSDDERRAGARFISDYNVVLRPSKDGAPIDGRATAHDVSLKGFKLEMSEEIPLNTAVFFTLELPEGQTAAGKGRIVWCKREAFAAWAGVEIISMSWGDKRRLNLLLHPDSVDWARMSDLCFKLIMSLAVVIAAHRVLSDRSMRGVFSALLPKAIALVIMGWALLGMFKRETKR